jgi:hypothetical protein
MVIELNNPELEAKAEEWEGRTGRPFQELVEDAVAIYLQGESELGSMLNSRYDDVKSGKVKLIDGEAFFESLRLREEQLLKHPASQ